MDIPLQLDMDGSEGTSSSEDSPPLPLQPPRIKNLSFPSDLRQHPSKSTPLKIPSRNSANGPNTMHSGFVKGLEGKNQESTKSSSSFISNGNRKRLNSRSQVLSSSSIEYPEKRIQMQYLVTLIPLNDTFVTKNLLVPYYPDTLKLGRPAGSKVKPEINNGYFDSRVLSRNHALIYVDPLNGKLMIKDLGSSNGTFLNEQKIGQDPVELNIGDIIYLGFNIEVDTSHKKILAKVENINVIPMKSKLLLGFSSSRDGDGINDNVNSPEYKHFNFVQLIFALKNPGQKNGQLGGVNLNLNLNLNQEVSSFDSALFGDVNPMLDNTLLGLQSKSSGGIFNNSQIANLSQLESAISLLLQCLLLVKQQNSTLHLLELFANNYQLRLEELNNKYIDEQYDAKFKLCNNLINEKEEAITRLTSEHDKYRKKTSVGMKGLEDEVDALRAQVSMLTQRLRDEEDTRTHSTSSIYLIDEKPVVTPPVSDDDNEFVVPTDREIMPNPINDENTTDISGNGANGANGSNGVTFTTGVSPNGNYYDIVEEEEDSDNDNNEKGAENDPYLVRSSQPLDPSVSGSGKKSALLDSLDTFDNAESTQQKQLENSSEPQDLVAGGALQAQEKDGTMKLMLHATAGLVLLILISFLSNHVSISHIGLS